MCWPAILLGVLLIVNGLLSLGGWGVRVSEVSSRQIGGGLVMVGCAWLMSREESALRAETAKGSERK